jgi:hypothetical protein
MEPKLTYPFTRRFDRRVRLLGATLGVSLLIGGTFGTYALWPANMETGYEPEQPIAFSHATMAGDFGIPCLYCHPGAENGPHAGLPDLETCMGCHRKIKAPDASGNDHPEIKKLIEHYNSRKPIQWKKVHDLADFVYFDHSRHVQSGIDCAECHGDVASMSRVRRVNSLKMGWCLECHRRPPDEPRPDGRPTLGPENCDACHR